jgi:TRAP-type mannitol/chloroaromatic compound transport system permease small subunit
MGLKSRRIVQVAVSIGFVLVCITGFGQVTARISIAR